MLSVFAIVVGVGVGTFVGIDVAISVGVSVACVGVLAMGVVTYDGVIVDVGVNDGLINGLAEIQPEIAIAMIRDANRNNVSMFEIFFLSNSLSNINYIFINIYLCICL